MPRSRNRVPRPVDPDEEDDGELEETWGWTEDLDELPDDVGEPPPQPRHGMTNEPATPPSAGLMALGPPPANALEAASWAYRLLMMQAYETMASNLPEQVRRKEVRTILRDAARHMTDAARYDYMTLVEGQKRQLEAKKRGRAQGKLQPRPPAPDGAKVIPIRRADG
jgi:hypothetical protein